MNPVKQVLMLSEQFANSTDCHIFEDYIEDKKKQCLQSQNII